MYDLVKVENIKVGDVIKNYKFMCNILNEDKKEGASRKYQIERWGRFFSYRKDGHKYIIEKIYDSPIEKSETRGGANNTVNYIENIEKLVLNLLAQEDANGQVFLSRNRMFQMLSMVNDNYSKGKYKTMRLSNYTNINKDEILDFYEASDNMLKRNLEKALNNLSNRSLITWKNSLTVGILHADVEKDANGNLLVTRINREDEYGDIETEFELSTPTKSIEHRKATVEEEKKILSYQREVLRELDLESPHEAIKKGKGSYFYKTVSDRLFEDELRIYLYYKSYEVIFNIEDVTSELEEYDELEELEKLILDLNVKAAIEKDLNNSIIDRYSGNVRNRYNNAIKKKDNGSQKELHMLRSSEKYIENSEKLCSILINTKIKDKGIFK